MARNEDFVTGESRYGFTLAWPPFCAISEYFALP
jgi:hypothetical protein